jgi:hypothetical protein
MGCFAVFGDVRWALVAPLAAGLLVGGSARRPTGESNET